jgi:hypothetical protein
VEDAKYVNYYTWKDINNLKCIVWNFPNNVKGVKRKSIKDAVAKLNIDNVMLDSKGSKFGKVFCDAIVVSLNVSKWLNRMVSHYSHMGMTYETEEINGGSQYHWYKDDDTYISASFYDDKNKMMVQPGRRRESNLLDWISDFAQLKMLDMKTHDLVDQACDASVQILSAGSLQRPSHVALPPIGAKDPLLELEVGATRNDQSITANMAPVDTSTPNSTSASSQAGNFESLVTSSFFAKLSQVTSETNTNSKEFENKTKALERKMLVFACVRAFLGTNNARTHAQLAVWGLGHRKHACIFTHFSHACVRSLGQRMHARMPSLQS